MTTYLPSICRACAHAHPGVVDGNGTQLPPATCNAYPNGIPIDIAFGDPHTTPRGDEQQGLTFVQAPGEAAEQAFDDWLRYAPRGPSAR